MGIALAAIACVAAGVLWHYMSFGPAADPNSPAGVAVQWLRCVAAGRLSLALPLMTGAARNSMQEYQLGQLSASWIVERGSLTQAVLRGVDDSSAPIKVIVDMTFTRGTFAIAIPMVQENGAWKVQPP